MIIFKDLFAIVILSILNKLIPFINCHGRMDDPPSRNSAWRFLSGFPPDYDDNGLNWAGICGGKRYEHGGKYATGKITKTYSSGEIITIKTLLTANHLGNIQLNLCPVDDDHPESQECFDKHKLEIITKSKLIGNDKHKAKVVMGEKNIAFDVKLPNGLVCDRCVLQWVYTAGNNPEGSVQETFRNCADIEIAPTKDIYSLIDTTSSEVKTPSIKLVPKKEKKKKKSKSKSNKKKSKIKKNKKMKKKPKTTTELMSMDMNQSTESL